MLEMFGPVAKKEDAGLDDMEVSVACHILPDLVVEPPHEVFLVLNIQLISGYLIVYHIDLHFVGYLLR